MLSFFIFGTMFVYSREKKVKYGKRNDFSMGGKQTQIRGVF